MINAKILYGVTVVNPEVMVQAVMEKPTWKGIFLGWLNDLLFLIVQSALASGSITAFAYSFGAFHG